MCKHASHWKIRDSISPLIKKKEKNIDEKGGMV